MDLVVMFVLAWNLEEGLTGATSLLVVLLAVGGIQKRRTRSQAKRKTKRRTVFLRWELLILIWVSLFNLEKCFPFSVHGVDGVCFLENIAKEMRKKMNMKERV